MEHLINSQVHKLFAPWAMQNVRFALVQFTGGIGGMSGSVAGNTFSHNRYGAYVRNRTIPVNPNSSRQQAARLNFSDVAATWQAALTQVQRDAWNLYGSSVVMKNRLGADVFLTGFAHYLRSGTAGLNAGLGVQEDGPVIFTLPESDSSFVPTISEATQLISVVFDTNLDWVGEDDAFMNIYMSQPRSGGREFIDGPFRSAGVILGDGTTPPTSPQTIAVPFAVAENQKVIVQARIGRADGRLSELFLSTPVVGA